VDGVGIENRLLINNVAAEAVFGLAAEGLERLQGDIKWQQD
jgi:hypothetical protein